MIVYMYTCIYMFVGLVNGVCICGLAVVATGFLEHYSPLLESV